MGLRVSVSTLAVGSLAAAMLVGAHTTPRAAASATPQILAGHLTTPAGKPLAGAAVTVSVTRDEGDTSVETPIATTTSGPDGSYTLTGDLGNAPHSTNPDGTIQLQIDVNAPGETRTYFVNARPPAAGRTAWTWGDAADSAVLPSAAQAGVSRAAAAAADGLLQAAAHKPLKGVDLKTLPVSRAGVTTATVAGRKITLANTSYSYCTHTWWTTESGHDIRRNVAVQHIATEDRAKQDYKWFTTKNTQLGIVVDEDISTSGGKVGAGFSYEKGTEKTSSTHPHFTTKFWTGHFNTEWRYRRQQMHCTYRNQYGEYHTMATKKHRYVPWNWTLGNSSAKDSRDFKCRSSTRSQYQISTATNTWQKLSGYFSIWGVKVTAEQKATTGDILTMTKRKGYKYFYICGNYSSDPGSSSAIWEQWRA